MKLTFRYNKEDYYDVLNLKSSDESLLKGSRIFNALIIPAIVLILLGTGFEYIRPNYLPSLIVAIAFIIFWLVVNKNIYDYNRRKSIYKLADLEVCRSIDSMKDTSITLTEDYLIREIEGFYSRIEWSFVDNVIVTNNSIFINLISRAIINIPKRVFDTRDEETLFLRNLNQHIKKNCGMKIDDKVDIDVLGIDGDNVINKEESNLDYNNKYNNVYSERITFINNKNYNNKGKWQKIVALVLLFTVVLTMGGTVIYNVFNRPTIITEEEIYNLIIESEVIEEKAFEEVKKTIEYEPSYVGSTYIIDIRTEKDGEILVDLGQQVNYPAAYVQLYGTVNLKYKRGWYIEELIYRDNYGLQPLFSAGESFLNGLSNDIYGKGYFEYNGVKYAFAPSYVDSLCAITEDGDFDSMKVGIAPYNKDGRIDMYVTMKYNFDIWGWELIEFETSGTR